MHRRTFLKLAAASLAVPLVGRTEPAVGPVVRLPLPKVAGLDRERLLHCIAQVESGGNDRKVGPVGERSKYQITYSVWVQHSPPIIRDRRTFSEYCNGVVADALARQHLDWIVACVGTSPFAIVAAWHMGVKGAARKQWGAKASDHVARTVRLYREA